MVDDALGLFKVVEVVVVRQQANEAKSMVWKG
jgi:hypothetical protein